MHWKIIDGFEAEEKDLTFYFSKSLYYSVEGILEWNKHGNSETSKEMQGNGDLCQGYLFIPLRSGIYNPS